MSPGLLLEEHNPGARPRVVEKRQRILGFAAS
jgi:hypothetical protein